MINIDRIIQTNIPDIAPVYGGVRGRTMSSSHQSYAWPTLVEAGVKRVIDLRDVDSSNKLPFLCDKYGMEYFHYPVNNHAKQVESMVALMPQFCEMIDKGDFYIACAMGLHRTDIALCTYWVFYAADKGIAPPPIRGYRQEDGHNTSKIMYVLNSIYKYMTEQNGVEPIPMETFKARKKVINELSKEKTEHEDVPLKRLYVDMDGVLADFESGLAKVDDEVKKEYLGRFDEIPGLFSLMEPMPGAIDAMHRIQKDGRYELYILSTAPWNNPSAWSDKLLWVQKHLDDVFHKRIVITHCKNLLKGDYLIDDRSKNGAKEFEGEWIQFGNSEFPDWDSVLNYLGVWTKKDERYRYDPEIQAYKHLLSHEGRKEREELKQKILEARKT